MAAGNAPESPGGGNDPGGNNGTVKVDSVELDDHDPPAHTPHADCTFVVEFYNYDADPLYEATLTFEFHAPTTRPQGSTQVILEDTVPIGEDAAGGGTDLDASRTYTFTEDDFAGVLPHDQQGHKVKLTIHADGSHGNDVKHKVFWVSCLTITESTTTTSSSTTTTTMAPTTTTSEATTTTTIASVAPDQAVVQGAVEVRPSTTPATGSVLGAQESLAQLPRTGVDPMLLHTGLLSTLAGLSCLAAGRRRR